MSEGAGQPGERPRGEHPLVGRPPEATRPARGAARRPLVGAVIAAALGAAVLTGIVGVLAETTGTIFVSGLVGAIIGLLVSATAVAPAPGSLPARSRAEAIRLATWVAIGMVIVAGFAIWVVGRIEGGVMDPISYLWTTLGLGLPFLGLVAAAAAAWGAANGPVRRG